jgi:transposase-like protein
MQVTLNFAGGSNRRNPCANILKSRVSDRAKRYRAHQPACIPSGPKRCQAVLENGARCNSTRFLTIDHKDGDESNGARSNLRWLCKSCNTRLGARDAREGRGRRTVQYNPKGAVSFEQWSEAIATLAGEGLGTMTTDQARDIVRSTSKKKRSEYNEDVWRIRKERYGPSGRKDGGAGGEYSEVPF